MARRSILGPTALVGVALLLAACPGVRGTAVEVDDLPRSIVAVGDSITTAAVPSLQHLQGSNPQLSWATGTEVASHYERLRDALGDAEVTRANVAVPGARMGDAPTQAQRAVESGAEYVTVMLGANDVCAGTDTAEFERSYVRALDVLFEGLPDAEVLVVSIPDVVGLWDLFAGDQRTRAIWDRTGACPEVLSRGADDASRDLARRRWVTYNQILTATCDQRDRCVHDGAAVAEHLLERGEVSTADRFHPSVEGQRRLAEITWNAWLQRRR